jgi:MFS family permease
LGGYTLPYYLAIGSAVIAILALLPAGEKRRQRRQPSAKGIAQLVIRPDVLLPALLNIVFQYGNYSSTMSFFPVLAKDLGASDVALGLLTGLHMGLSTLGTLTVTAIVRRVGEQRIVYFAFGAMMLGVAGAALVSSVPLVFVAQSLMGMAWGMGYPTLMGLSIRQVDDEQRSTAMGLHQAVYSIGMFAGPWLSGILADGLGMRPMFAITGVVCGVVGLLGTTKVVADK